MNKEMILKLLASLGVKVTADGAEGSLKEDVAVKLVEDLISASNLGLVQKRDELLAQEVALKAKIEGLEKNATDTAKKQTELELQLKKSQS